MLGAPTPPLVVFRSAIGSGTGSPLVRMSATQSHTRRRMPDRAPPGVGADLVCLRHPLGALNVPYMPPFSWIGFSRCPTDLGGPFNMSW